ncbi:unnamed protein product [Agarophyton chilense]|eukprot:gb/GEZJ01000724.1/.p1 GENE.gb/GEZJ01000724.1/~~gb/GEZJ01000724.1/.p1  ORF type:complete len:287 (+),score=45.14 gb/GEZJ01000724.1/:250-1110(+)
MAETPCAQAAPVASHSTSLPLDAQGVTNAAEDHDSIHSKLSSPDADDSVLELLPELTTAHSTPDLAQVHNPQQIRVPSKRSSFCRKIVKNKNGAKDVPKIEVAQPLAPALSAASHPLATIPLAPAMSAYSFPALANPSLLAHPFVSLPLQAPRRAVRIAPMGVLPLPPPGAAALVADFHAASVVPDEAPRLHEICKAKRRGSTVATVVSEQALSPEERTRQKRMLRNRESAARSRDKRRNRNIQLQRSIQRYRDKKKAMDEAIQELKLLCECMRHTLEKHNIAVPP